MGTTLFNILQNGTKQEVLHIIIILNTMHGVIWYLDIKPYKVNIKNGIIISGTCYIVNKNLTVFISICYIIITTMFVLKYLSMCSL